MRTLAPMQAVLQGFQKSACDALLALCLHLWLDALL